MKNKRKIIPIILSIFLAMLLSGCGTANIGVNTTLEKDGSGICTYKLATTGIFAQNNPSAKKDDAKKGENDLFKGVLDKVESKKYKDGEKNIEEKTIKFKNVQELNMAFKDAKADDLKVRIEENKQLFKTTYVYTMMLPKEFSMESMKKEIDKQKESAQALGVSDDQILSFVGQAISFSASIKLPGEIVKQNATSVNGNTLKWDYAFSQVDPQNVMSATCEVKNETNIYIASAIAVVVLVFVGIVVIRKVKKNKK